ncbi:MAG: formylglycine-generating enzyme family protein, partial [Planctomyces sp.]
WCAGSVGSADAPGPRPVGTRQPNPLGLHDVHGNVFEWCLDWFDPDYYLRSPAADPSGPLEPPAPADTETLAERVCRGGSWARNDVTCSSGFRFSASDEDSRSSLEFGFRVVAEDRGAPQAR